MTQFVGRHVSPELLALGMIELLLTFALAYILVAPAGGGLTLAATQQALICAIVVGFVAFVIGLYRPQIFQRAGSLVFNTILSALLSFPVVWVISKGLGLNTYWPVGYDSLRPVKIVLIWTAALLAIRLIFLFATRLNLFVHRVALLGPSDSPSIAAALRAGRKGFLEIDVADPAQASAQRLGMAGVRTLVFSSQSLAASPTAEEYQKHGINVESEATFWERRLRRVDIDGLDLGWFARLDAMPAPVLSSVINRVMDVLTSLGLLVTTLPLMLIVALLVRLDSPGPILYRQERVGRDGKVFTLLKFRSMRIDAETRGPTWAQQRDPRVTRTGSFMRRSRIDELPQLLNILRGEMSFIGPRPERPHFVEQLAASIPFYRERARVKPGLTGWAQVNYPYGASVEDAQAKLSYDLYYVKNRSVMLDALILLSTVRVILFQEGAR